MQFNQINTEIYNFMEKQVIERIDFIKQADIQSMVRLSVIANNNLKTKCFLFD